MAFLKLPSLSSSFNPSLFFLLYSWQMVTLYNLSSVSSCTVYPVCLEISAFVSIFFFPFLYLRNSCPFTLVLFLPSIFALNSIFLYQLTVHLQEIDASLVILGRKGMSVLIELSKALERQGLQKWLQIAQQNWLSKGLATFATIRKLRNQEAIGLAQRWV